MTMRGRRLGLRAGHLRLLLLHMHQLLPQKLDCPLQLQLLCFKVGLAGGKLLYLLHHRSLVKLADSLRC